MNQRQNTSRNAALFPTCSVEESFGGENPEDEDSYSLCS